MDNIDSSNESIEAVVAEAKDVVLTEVKEKVEDIKDDITDTIEDTKKELIEAKNELIEKIPDALSTIKLKIKNDISEGKISLKSPADIPVVVMNILKDDMKPIIESILKDVISGIELEPHIKAILKEAIEGDWYDVMKILKENSTEIMGDIAEDVAEKALKTGCFGLMGMIMKAMKK
jgi:hypothetical protein